MSSGYDPSPAVLRTLAGTFWSGQGWRPAPRWPDADSLAAAVRAGVMFERPRTLDHDGWVRAARSAAAAVSSIRTGGAFLASLGTRRLDLRSALGSYAIARRLPGHSFSPAGDIDPRGGYTSLSPSDCGICGSPALPGPADLNLYSFERFKWGGVRRDSVPYIAFDLEQFGRAPEPDVSGEAVAVAGQLFSYLRGLPAGTTAARAAAGLTMIKGNRAERENVLDILAVCGILQPAGRPGYAAAFVPASERLLPGHRFVFGHYPACWWTGADGVSHDAASEFFPQLS